MGTDTKAYAGQIYKDLGCSEHQTLSFIQEVLEDIQLFDRKQRDYGPQNIATFMEKGVLVRANDKMARLVNLLWTLPGSIQVIMEGEELKPIAVANESIEDSWRDLSVYGVIARLCRKGLWNS